MSWPPTAHPRSRGENWALGARHVEARGSSPLTRGKHGNTMPLGALIGLIPAHAGKTPRPQAKLGDLRAHPRSRGENARLSMQGWSKSGSSPLTRGKPVFGLEVYPGTRLIPAHAGKTFRSFLSVCRGRAHPRSRGENCFDVGAVGGFVGSSPLTRGKRLQRLPIGQLQRLIPAHAGKTKATRSPRHTYPAHPRSRGENCASSAHHIQFHGSSPLTRGKPQSAAWGRDLRRLIPAHAGKTRSVRRRAGHLRAHPRSRGENRSRSSTSRR